MPATADANRYETDACDAVLHTSKGALVGHPDASCPQCTQEWPWPLIQNLLNLCGLHAAPPSVELAPRSPSRSARSTASSSNRMTFLFALRQGMRRSRTQTRIVDGLTPRRSASWTGLRNGAGDVVAMQSLSRGCTQQRLSKAPYHAVTPVTAATGGALFALARSGGGGVPDRGRERPGAATCRSVRSCRWGYAGCGDSADPSAWRT